MGSCLSKKSACATVSASSVPRSKTPGKAKSDAQFERNEAEEETVKKEIFVIKHKKSNDLIRGEEGKPEVKSRVEVDEICGNVAGNCASGNGVDSIGERGIGGVRTSSCTKEELDAILIQCGRLSRNSSTGKGTVLSESGGKKYSGSKRSYDFDDESGGTDGNAAGDGDVCDGVTGRGSENRHRQRNRQSSGRRRTPSRERERELQRSSSKERNGSGGGGGRRVSRSPGRRSESPSTSGVSNSSAAMAVSRPEKMVSVPAMVSSIPVDKNGNTGGAEPAAMTRVQVKRNAGGDVAAGTRTASSPRARSPARIKASNENQNPNSCQILSRSNSRKAEISPFRRNPLGEIDTNIILQTPLKRQNAEKGKTIQGAAENRLYGKTEEEILVIEEDNKGSFGIEGHGAVNVIISGAENLKPHTLIRSRSSRLSKDLDANPECLPNPTASYTSLLLEDIQNFHQKNSTPAAFSLPPCVTKACSILEAVADLNSSTGSNTPSTFTQDQPRNAITNQFSKSNGSKPVASAVGKMRPETRSPVVESEVVVHDDLMDPTFHKYVTVCRGSTGLEELDEQESSGSNSFLGGQQNWMSSSCLETNSADLVGRQEPSKSVRRQNEVGPVKFQRHAASSDSGQGSNDAGRSTSAKKRELDNQQNGIGRGGRNGSRGTQKVPVITT